MNKKLFDEAIGELSPSTVDLDEVVARGRRSVTIRRVVSPVLGVVVAVVLVVVTAAALPPAGQPRFGIVATAPPETSSTPTEATSSSAPSGTCAEQAAETRQRLTVAVGELVGERLQSMLELTNSPAAHDDAGTTYGPLEFFQKTTPRESTSCAEDPPYLAYANVAVADLMGSITVKVSRSRLPIQPCPDPLPYDLMSCEESTGPDGEQILLRHVREYGDTSSRYIAWVNKGDTSVEVTSSHTAEPGTPGNPGGTPNAPLFSHQVLEVALDPRVTLPRSE